MSAAIITSHNPMVAKVHAETYIFDALATSVIDRDYVDVMRSVGIDAVHYTVANMSMVQGELRQDDFKRACRRIARWLRTLEELDDVVGLATTVDEMKALQAEHKVAIFFGMQNASPIEDDIDFLDIFYRLGIRFVQLTYNARNMLGDGSGEPTDAGLSNLGVAAIERMNELGILIDLSHCGDATTMEAIECSRDPVAVTHANARALANTPRNKSDDQLRAVAKKGGVAGVKHMIGNTVTKSASETTYRDIADHLLHMVKIMGIDHVCIGTDFRGTTIPNPTKDAELAATRRRWSRAYIGKRAAPAGFQKITDLPNLTAELLARGLAVEDIAKIYGGNLTRLVGQVLG